MNDTAWKEELIATKKSCHVSRDELVKKLRASQQHLAEQLKTLGLEQNRTAERQANEKLRDSYYSKCLAAKYPIVDLSFTNAKMRLIIERRSNGCRVLGLEDRPVCVPQEQVYTFPRYAKQIERASNWEGGLLKPLADPKHALGKFLFPEYQKDRVKHRTYTGEVCCNRPAGSPPSLIEKLQDIVAIGMESHAAAVRGNADPGNPAFGRVLLWKPRIEDLYITEGITVRDDPAVLVTSGEHHHLVAFWDSPEECPIEGVIREFSEGALDDFE